jgi:photosystem II stability/assembly factor-like uncharacterized protein
MAGTSGGWERVAGNAGGTVGGLATATVDGRTVVFAATSVGVYRSSDAGQTWTLPGAGNTVPFAEVVAPSARFGLDRTIFVCAGDGVYRSSDGGEAWQPVLVGSRMFSLATAPSGERESVVLAGTETDGVLRSADSGRTWTGANAGLLDLTALALALSPQFGSDRVGFAGTASGLYRTRNGGGSWRAIETDLNEPAVQCVAVSPTFGDDRLVLAGTEADGLVRSTDAGSTWDRPASLVDQGVTALAFSSRYPSKPTIAAAIESGIAISDDGGTTWRMTGSRPGLVLSLIFVASDGGEVLLAGLHRDGVARSRDDGRTWEVTNAGLDARLLTCLALSPAFAQDQTLFAAGPQDGVSVSADGGRTWTERNAGLDDAGVLGLAVSPAYARDRTLYVATAAGIHVSRDAGATWAGSAASEPARAVVTGPARGSAPPSVVAAMSGGRLLASNDAARTWRTLADSFDGGEIILLAHSPGYAVDRTLFVATSRSGPGQSGEVVLWRSVDGGARWDQWFVERGAGGGDGQAFMALAISPGYPVDQLVFVGLGSRVLTPLRHARVKRAGQRRPVWRPANLGSGAAATTAVAPSPEFSTDRTVFVATNAGVFVSRDGSESFQLWSDGLAPPRVVALAVSPSYVEDHLVYALGLGGTIWRREDRAR